MDPDKLPRFLTTFVGRQSEVSELARLVGIRRLVTLTGVGGCGKTRLAAEIAAGAVDRFPDGVWWVELAPIGDAQLVAPELARVLELRPMPGQTDLEAVVSHLEARRALLVLDNCEHLVSEVAPVAETVARGCPHVRTMATSREPLRAEGEIEWRVPSLSLPSPGGEEEPDDGSDAVRLFVERAEHVRPAFRLTRENGPAITRICRELDGIPLAIELAAAGLRAFTVEQIAAGLVDCLRDLTGGTRTAVPRQQTLRASVEWSHELLSGPERAGFRRLAVFVGGFTLEAAERVCSREEIGPDQVHGILAALVDKSLVQAEERGPAMRYRMLEVVRQYALERLDQSNEADSTRDRHRDVFLDFAERAAPELLTPRQPEFMDVLDPEAANFALAIDRACSTQPDKALRLCVALTFWWRLRSLFAQGEAGFARALDAATAPSELRARALWGRAFLLTFGGDLPAAFPAAQTALDAGEAVGDDSTAARALWLIGIATMWPDPSGSRPALERAGDLAVASGDDLALMHATQGLGMSYLLQDEHRQARPFHAEAFRLAERLGQQDALAWYWVALAFRAWVAGDQTGLRDAAETAILLARRSGDVVTEAAAVCGLGLAEVDAGHAQRGLEPLVAVRERALARGGGLMLPVVDWTIAVAHAAEGRLDEARCALEMLIGQGAGGWQYVLSRAYVLLAEVARLLGDVGCADVAAQDGLDVARRSANRIVAGEATLVLGRLAAARHEWAEAQRLYHEALPTAVEDGSPRLPRLLEALAEAGAGSGSHLESARALGAARQQWSDMGVVAWPHQRAERDALEARVREALGADAFERALAEGKELSADEAVAYVRRSRGQRKRPAAGWESLTPTELSVARLAGEGLTNPEIGARMFVSRGTVRTHLSHIFTKLGLKNRAELAREVARHDDAPEH